MDYIFIVNPLSRSGMGLMIWEQLEPELKRRRVTYKVFLTSYAGHAKELAREVTKGGATQTIIALGGDGTVNEIINGIVDVEQVILGYIPTGSSNDFARGLSLPQDPQEALDIIIKGGSIRSMDVGCISWGNETRKFAVSAGIGFDAAICHEATNSKIKLFLNRLKMGKLTYVCIALHRLFRDKRVPLTVYTDGKERHFKKSYFVAIMNIPYEGGGFYFCPKADSQDGMLDLMVIAGLPKILLMILLPTAYKGWHVHFPGVHIFRCQKAVIAMENTMAMHTDGEPMYVEGNMKAEVLDKKIRVIVRKEQF